VYQVGKEIKTNKRIGVRLM